MVYARIRVEKRVRERRQAGRGMEGSEVKEGEVEKWYEAVIH